MQYDKIVAGFSAFTIALTSLVMPVTANAATTFTDNDQIASWAADSVAALATAGVLTGRPDGSFDPKGTLNRAELAKIAQLGSGLSTDTTGAPHFNDVAATDWFFSFVETLYNNNVVGGINSGALDANGMATYNPGGTVNRAEAAKILVEAFGLEAAHTGASATFPDVSSDAWYFDYVETAYAHGLLNGYENGSFGPADPVTREQVSVIAQNSVVEAADGSKRRDTYVAGAASTAIADETTTETTETTTSTLPPSDGTLSVALSASTPAGQTVPAGASGIPVMDFDLTASSAGDVTFTGVKLVKTGISDNTSISNVYLYDGANRLTTGRTITSSDSSVNFSNLNVLVTKGTTKTLKVVIDTATTVTSGQSYGFKITAAEVVTSNAKSVSGTFPVTGNSFTASSTAAGTITATTNGTIVAPKVGEKGIVLSKFKLTAGSAEGALVNQIALIVGGTISPSAVQNTKLYQGGVELAAAKEVNSKDLLVFTLTTPFKIEKGDSRNFEVKGDLNTGRTGDTLALYVDETTDVTAIGDKYGFGLAVTNTLGSGNVTAVTLLGGDITISSSGPSAAKVAVNGKDVVLQNFNITANSPATFRKFAVGLTPTENTANAGLLNGTTANYTDIKVTNKKTGAVVFGPIDSTSLVTAIGGTTLITEAAGDNAVAYYAFSDEFTMAAGDSLDLVLTADVANNSSLATDTLYGSLVINSTYPEVRDVNNKVVTNSSSIVPSTTIDGKTQTVVSDSLTVALASTPVSKTFVKGTQSVCFAGFNMKAGDAGDVKLTQLKVEGSIETSDAGTVFSAGSEADGGAVTRYVKDAVGSVKLMDGTTPVGTLKSVQADGSATFDNLTYVIPAGVTKTLSVCGDLSSSTSSTITGIAFVISAAANVVAENKDGGTVTATATNVNNTVAAPTTSMTVAGVGTLTVKEEGSPNATVLVAGATAQKVSKYKISAVNEAFTVKKLDLALDTNGDFTTASPETTYASSIVRGTITYKDKAGAAQTASANFSGGKAQFSNLTLYVPQDGNTTIDVAVDLNTISGGATTGDNIKVGIYENALTANNSFEAISEGSGATVNAATAATFTAAGSNVKTHILRKTVPTLAKQTAATNLTNASDLTLYSFSVAADAGAAVSFGRIVFDVTTSNTITTNVKDFAFYKGSSKFADTTTNIYALGASCTDGTQSQDVTVTGTKGLANAKSVTNGCADALGVGGVLDGTYKVIVSFNTEETIPAGSPSQTYSLKATVSGAATGDSIGTKIAIGDESTALSGLSAGANTTAQNTGRLYAAADATTGIVTAANTDFSKLVGTARNIIWSDNSSTSHAYATVSTAGVVTTATGTTDFTNGYLLKSTDLSSQTLTY